MDILLAPAAAHKPAGMLIRVTFQEAELSGEVAAARADNWRKAKAKRLIIAAYGVTFPFLHS
jgi:hypothetical protein